MGGAPAALHAGGAAEDGAMEEVRLTADLSVSVGAQEVEEDAPGGSGAMPMSTPATVYSPRSMRDKWKNLREVVRERSATLKEETRSFDSIDRRFLAPIFTRSHSGAAEATGGPGDADGL